MYRFSPRHTAIPLLISVVVETTPYRTWQIPELGVVPTT